MDQKLADKYAQLVSNIQQLGHVVVAFSGGIDSSLVAFLAGRELGDKALAVTSGSSSLKRSDLELSRKLARSWNIRHEIVTTDELSNSSYRANPINRCYFCKTSLYTLLADLAKDRGITHILNGTNCDDLGDHRPGLIAADEHRVKSPLVDAGFNKADIRQLSEHLGLENAKKPQAACLSSRFPYGTQISTELLAQVEQAEVVLQKAGFKNFRVRHHGEVARLEIGLEEMPKALELGTALNDQIKNCGYRFVSLDLAGFRSGSLNEGLIPLVEHA